MLVYKVKEEKAAPILSVSCTEQPPYNKWNVTKCSYAKINAPMFFSHIIRFKSSLFLLPFFELLSLKVKIRVMNLSVSPTVRTNSSAHEVATSCQE